MDAGFGPALYLMAANSQRKGRQMSKSEAIGYFRAAAQSGHIPSKIWVWRLSKLGFWRRLARVIPLLFTVVRFFAIGVRNYNVCWCEITADVSERVVARPGRRSSYRSEWRLCL
jgi:hypothetical protein